MSLRRRLASLRGGTISAPSVGGGPRQADTNPVRGLDQARRARTRPVLRRSLDDRALAARLGGSCTAPGLIELARKVPLAGVDATSLVPVLADLGGEEGAGRAVFMDTETTGLAGGTGTVPFLVGLARLDGAVLQIRQFLLSGFGGEPALLERASGWMGGAGVVVTFNGKSFDGPLLATRYRLGRCVDPLEGMKHVDLLHPLRSAFRDRWPDCRLRTAEERLLGRRRVGDIPGSEVPAAWFAWIHRGIAGELQRVLEHNRVDLVSLVELVSPVHDCLRDPVGRGARVPPAVRRCRGPSDEERMLAYLTDRRGLLDAEGLRELGGLARRRGQWRLAAEIWRELAGDGDPDALERLAKYHEHVSPDLALALESVERLIALQPGDPGHLRRRRRLLSRMGTAPN